MTIVGLAEATVAPLIRAVSGDDADSLDREQIAERFARSAWSGIAEPGDGDAGLLIAALGAVAALELLTARVSPPRVVELLAARGWQTKKETWSEAFKRWQPRVASPDALRGLSQAARFGCRMLVPGDPFWPTGLDDLGTYAPHLLWARGDVTRLQSLGRSIAIVGARAATGYGEHVTVEAASGLVDRGFAIVSGAAYGIDGIAHRAALASQGTTVAVLAGGLDRFYPSGHEQLLIRIVDRGVVLAEVPPATAPTKWRFLQRNRLIAALSQATVVVEAGWRSGSINTASHAFTMGRPVGAVPGPVTSSASAGCHQLLRTSPAELVTTPDEMAELVPAAQPAIEPASVGDDTPMALAPSAEPPLGEPSSTRTRVLDALSRTSGRRIDRIAALSGLALDRVRAELGLMELEGLVRELPSGWMRQKAERSSDEANREHDTGPG
jgi:DNA processing protein